MLRGVRRYSEINLAKQEAEIFCDEPFVHEQIFCGYSKIRHSRAEEFFQFKIHNSKFKIMLRAYVIHNP